MNSQEINEFIKKKHEEDPTYTNAEISELLSIKGIDRKLVGDRRRRLGLQMKLKSYKQRPIEEEVAEAKEAGDRAVLKKKYGELMKAYVDLQIQLDEAFKLKNHFETFKIEPRKKSGTSEATAFIVASDWHIEEEVRPETINNLNHFNLEIADQRIKKFYQNSLSLLKNAQQGVNIKEVVLCLLGDFFTGTSHPEFAETNQLLPGDAAWQAQKYLASGIKFYLENTDCRFTIICHAGNHSRMTPKIHIATETGNSLETYLYRNLAQYFEKEPRVKFIVADGYITYLDVYGQIIRIHHGHNVKFQGGTGGIEVPLKKAIAQWNKGRTAVVDVLGHWHQLRGGPGDSHIVNGSLIGYNAFALSIKADYEPPRQAFFLFDRDRGKTLVAPITL